MIGDFLVLVVRNPELVQVGVEFLGQAFRSGLTTFGVVVPTLFAERQVDEEVRKCSLQIYLLELDLSVGNVLVSQVAL